MRALIDFTDSSGRAVVVGDDVSGLYSPAYEKMLLNVGYVSSDETTDESQADSEQVETEDANREA